MRKTVAYSGKFRRIISSKIAGIICLLVVISLVVTMLIKFEVIKFLPTSETSVVQRSWQVEKGDLELKLSDSGTVYSSDEEEVTTEVAGTVTKVYFNEGDTVKKGELLYEIDDSDAQLEYEKVKNNLFQSEINLSDAVKNISGLKVIAPFSGLVTGLTVKKGEMVNKNSSIMTIKDESYMNLIVNFDGISTDDIIIDQKATVYIQDINQSIQGNVVDIRETGKSNKCSVEIEIKNPGLLESDMVANASIVTSKEEIWSDGTAKLKPVKTQIIKSDVSGVVKEIYAVNNNYVNVGSVLMVLEDDKLITKKELNEKKVEELKATLQQKQKQLGYYMITAPIDGTIVTQDIEAGDEVNVGESLATVSNNNSMKLKISIDELDIAKLKIGLDARVSVDALDETALNPIAGKVSEISHTATTSGGDTTYSVMVDFDNPGNVKDGMNATAEIVLSKTQDVLFVPVEAIHTSGDKKTVWVKKDDNIESKDNSNKIDKSKNVSDYYSNAMEIEIDTGVNTEEYVEVTSGLNKGDQIILPAIE